MTFQPDTNLLDEYRSFRDGFGYVPLTRTLIELTGTDRASFLSNFCTNDVVSLSVGQGCEAFFTNVQGKVLGHGLVFCEEDRLVVDSVAGQAKILLPHLDRYLIREDVQLDDRSDDTAFVLLSGGELIVRLSALLPAIPSAPLEHLRCEIAGVNSTIRRVGMTGSPAILLACELPARNRVQAALQEATALACTHETYEMARIEAGWPEYGTDITAENLPQEVGRDAQAISFTKGCYLGQETVARIDALGHVNWNLVGVQFDGDEIPGRECALTSNEKTVGRITSAAYSPAAAAPLALAYVRREYCATSCVLDSIYGSGKIVPLPVGY